MRLSTLILALAALLSPAAPFSGAAQAQSEFAPVLTVNGMAITGYELDQRIKFLQVVGVQGDLQAQAEQALIEDRLRMYAGKQAGVSVSEEVLRGGLDEFASRANLTTDQFLQAIGQGGVDPETFRDFVRAGITWREVVRARFAGRIKITDAEIDRELSITAKRGAGPKVLLSEIIIPIRADNAFVAERTALKLSEALKEGASFAESARKFSAAPSRDDGGQIGWIPLTNLPPGVREIVAKLGPGQISEPLQVPGGIALFQMRGTEQGSPEVQSGSISLDYLTLALPSQAEVAKANASVSTCADLYYFARSYPSSQLTHQFLRAGSVPSDIGSVLANLDENEMTVVSRGGVPTVVMLCSRTAVTADGASPEAAKATAAASANIPFSEEAPPKIEADLGFALGPSREGVRQELANVRVAQLADQYLAQLKASAVIVRMP